MDTEIEKISEYTKGILSDMSVRVLEYIAKKFEKVMEGVKKIMGGQILEYEAKTIWNEGKAEGEKEGRMEGRTEGKKESRMEGRKEGERKGFLDALFGLVRDGLLPIADAAERANMKMADFEKAYRTFLL